MKNTSKRPFHSVMTKNTEKSLTSEQDFSVKYSLSMIVTHESVFVGAPLFTMVTVPSIKIFETSADKTLFCRVPGIWAQGIFGPV